MAKVTIYSAGDRVTWNRVERDSTETATILEIVQRGAQQWARLKVDGWASTDFQPPDYWFSMLKPAGAQPTKVPHPTGPASDTIAQGERASQPGYEPTCVFCQNGEEHEH